MGYQQPPRNQQESLEGRGRRVWWECSDRKRHRNTGHDFSCLRKLAEIRGLLDIDLMEEWTMEAVKAQEGKVISCKSVTTERHTFGRVLTRRDTWHGDSRSRWMTKGGPTMQQQQVCTASRYFRQGQRQATSEQVHRRGQHELPSGGWKRE